jgi:uncharacterized phage-associated protein
MNEINIINNEAMFSVDTVARYLNYLKPNISPVRLHKSLYFLFAYYGATCANENGEGVFEDNLIKPKYLFNTNIEAWTFGSVIREVYNKYENDNAEYIDDIKITEAKIIIENAPEVKKYIDELFVQIDSVSEFKLIERNKSDNVWKDAYSVGKTTIINNDKIIDEYKERYM